MSICALVPDWVTRLRIGFWLWRYRVLHEAGRDGEAERAWYRAFLIGERLDGD